VAYRKLNVTKKVGFPLSKIDNSDTSQETNGSPRWTLKAVTGRWICIRTTRLRSRRIKGDGSAVMPFSVCNAPVTFEPLMDKVLKES
jgi:hypothetical protein